MMDRERWDRIQEVFHRAADLGEAERERVLQEACAGDTDLLDHVRVMIAEDSCGGSLLDRDVEQVAGRILNQPAIREVGRYQIQRLLGEGGMGAVYLAARKDLGDLVELKILRDTWPSPARLRRFESEQRTLAQLSHPSIARLYDAGTLADGTPWFVMEYVGGIPLTEYGHEHHCAVDARLKLFRAVCEAVEYARQHGVIHRDLKPSNILVRADGSVRLLDFGIAKQIDAGAPAANQSRSGSHLLTPAYASPEQIRGETLGLASDVYSLGVILYELLARQLPFDLSDKTPAEAANLIAMEDPVKPSAVVRRNSANTATRTASWTDLDVLCLTAMQKERRRRYSSVKALSGDLDHYLKRQPLDAHADSPMYVAGKFLRRNWAAASVAALLLFAGSLALTLRRGPPAVGTRPRTQAVLRFVNTGSDQSMDFLGSAISEEIARVRGRARSLTVRPFDASRAGMDSRKAARELSVTTVISGRFLKEGDQLQVSMEALDVDTNYFLWRDAFVIPAANTRPRW
jgi:serine/threonine protein kinase